MLVNFQTCTKLRKRERFGHEIFSIFRCKAKKPGNEENNYDKRTRNHNYEGTH